MSVYFQGTKDDEALASIEILQKWRDSGIAAATKQLRLIQETQPKFTSCPLYKELELRLSGKPGPRVLVDGVWFCRAYGGITRVWDQILSCWSLEGMVSDAAPVCVIERGNHRFNIDSFQKVNGKFADPLDSRAVLELATENAFFVSDWNADVFVSSWISTSGPKSPSCSEIALVHDCLPERFQAPPLLKNLRNRWLRGASAHLAVSAATADDLEKLLGKYSGSIPWCHLAPTPTFANSAVFAEENETWRILKRHSGIAAPYVLLPATSAIGSYKNPELLLEALSAPGLEQIQLIVSGIGAEIRQKEFEDFAPALKGRILAAGFTDSELSLVYQNALAVIIPSRIEGFGLPVIEALASKALVLVADSRGLVEAGGKACLRFSADKPKELVQLLQLILDRETWRGFDQVLIRRRNQRLSGLSSDLLGLCLLAAIRSLASGR
ncbi:glycosyltransferase [Prochlorococcus sp. MIT 1300]|uniref:glycosyltransferase n=1 Tax=Prochlorococcus sp. MIT 1300 TaxID=3096218 RepID=UPI002A75606C|nr:glycosyltransferase [Prochlorococcus sp. MIT 1300]